MAKTDFPNFVLGEDPSIHPTAFVAAGAQVIGKVRLGKDASVWYNCVLRGDINDIQVGERSNIQDGSILHVENETPCIVGNDVTVGHHANIHACTVEDACLIGIGAILLSGCKIGKGSVIGAGAVVKERTVVEPGTLWVGIPAKKVKKLSPEVIEINKKWAAKYVLLAKAHRAHYPTHTSGKKRLKKKKKDLGKLL